MTIRALFDKWLDDALTLFPAGPLFPSVPPKVSKPEVEEGTSAQDEEERIRLAIAQFLFNLRDSDVPVVSVAVHIDVAQQTVTLNKV